MPETRGSPLAIEIPPELLSSVDPSVVTDKKLRHRYDLVQQALLLAQSSPDNQFLQEQAAQIGAALAERQVEATVQADLGAFLAEFSAITVTVNWVEDTGTGAMALGRVAGTIWGRPLAANEQLNASSRAGRGGSPS